MSSYFQRLFEYDNWAKIRLAQSIGTLQEVPERVISLYAHLLASNNIWQARLLGTTSTMAVWEHIPVSGWLAQQEVNQKQIIEFLQQANGDFHTQDVTYKTTKGIPYHNTVEGILSHMITHSSYHMGQINLQLKPFLDPLPDLMYISYQREQKD